MKGPFSHTLVPVLPFGFAFVLKLPEAGRAMLLPSHREKQKG